ncbi:MAG: hypothetical protein HMLKMBBP_01288 [Planctomycetes bacterium]|nr:hypothetical protein [Planctomycetota bacterium]
MAKTPRAEDRKPDAKIDVRTVLVLSAIWIAVALLWRTPVVYPLKVFVVTTHELSHGIAAVLTGGRIDRVEVTEGLGGLCVTSGGTPFVIASAGYLGSVAFGAAFLLLASRTRLSSWLAAATGILVALVAFRYMPPGSFGRWFAALMGVLLASLAALPPMVSRAAMQGIGVTSCLYAIVDIKTDILDQDHASSDAAALERISGVPSVLWGFLWIVVSAVVAFIAVKRSVTGRPPEDAPARKAAA